MKYILITSLFLTISCGSSSNNANISFSVGEQIDRMGRPAVNTALNKPFTADAVRGAAEDSYNQTKNSNASSFKAEMAGNLAIYDALVDEAAGGADEGCGDNPLTNRLGANPGDGLATGNNRYDFIATVLVDDQLYINATSTGGSEAGDCNQYLAAELTVIGTPGLENDCGGRTPNQDVIEVTYSAVAAGGVSGVDDGIASDDVTHSETVFPFLAGPK